MKKIVHFFEIGVFSPRHRASKLALCARLNKNVLVSLLILLSLAASAQSRHHNPADRHHIRHIRHVEQLPSAKSDYYYQLAGFQSDDYYETTHYSYDDQQRLVAVIEESDYYLIDSLFYNGLNQLQRLSGWQEVSGELKNVYYVEYSYDSAGNIASRINYNFYDGEWCQGGVYEYSYDECNRLILTTLTMGNTQMQRVEYSYNEDGNLQKELWYDGYGHLYADFVAHYSYNEQGLLVAENDSTSDDEGVSWVYYGLRQYAYDAYGNCVQTEYFDHTHRVADRHVYSYDYNMPLAQVLMPWHPEIERPKTFCNAHAYRTESWYTVDVDHNLQYVCDYNYDYIDLDAGVTHALQPLLQVYPNPASNQVRVMGLSEAVQKVRVFDEGGRVVLETALSASQNSLDISRLGKGVYLLRVGNQTGKLMVQ